MICKLRYLLSSKLKLYVKLSSVFSADLRVPTKTTRSAPLFFAGTFIKTSEAFTNKCCLLSANKRKLPNFSMLRWTASTTTRHQPAGDNNDYNYENLISLHQIPLSWTLPVRIIFIHYAGRQNYQHVFVCCLSVCVCGADKNSSIDWELRIVIWRKVFAAFHTDY